MCVCVCVFSGALGGKHCGGGQEAREHTHFPGEDAATRRVAAVTVRLLPSSFRASSPVAGQMVVDPSEVVGGGGGRCGGGSE